VSQIVRSPYEADDPPCDVCHLDPCGGSHGCKCPECLYCTEAGNPACSVSGGAGCEAEKREFDKQRNETGDV